MATGKTSTLKTALVVGAKIRKPGERTLPAEVPVAFAYNGVSHVVMMTSPADLEDFAVGFSLSEEIVKDPGDIEKLEVVEASQGFVAQIKIPRPALKALLERDRNLVGQTGCGLCGVAEIEDAVRNYSPIATRPETSGAAIFKALKALPALQPLNKKTAAVHAAAFCSFSGDIECVREDVGRHNALDKLIGALTRQGQDLSKGFVLLTSRCSFELVQKALAMKIPMLAAISAPTALAVDLAERHKLTLVALARPDTFQVYNDPFGVFGQAGRSADRGR